MNTSTYKLLDVQKMLLNIVVGIVLFANSAFSQDKPADAFSQLVTKRWNLNEYLWSFDTAANARKKSHLDFTTIDNWQSAGTYFDFNSKGDYIAYTIEKISNSHIDSIIIQSVNQSWRLAFENASPGFFSKDGRQYIFRQETQLLLLKLDKKQKEYISDVGSYEVSPDESWIAVQLKSPQSDILLRNLTTGHEIKFPHVINFKFDESGQWLVCQIKNHLHELYLYHLETGKEVTFEYVVDYFLGDNGNEILLNRRIKTSTDTVSVLEYVSLSNEREKITIWATSSTRDHIAAYDFDKSSEQVVFSITETFEYDKKLLQRSSIWYYKKGMHHAVLKLANSSPDIKKRFDIQKPVGFSKNGRFIHFLVHPIDSITRKKSNVDGQPEVWSYKDNLLQSQQNSLLMAQNNLQALFCIDDGRVTFLEGSGRNLLFWGGHFAVFNNLPVQDRFWEKYPDSTWLFDLNKAESHLINRRIDHFSFWTSPEGNYLVYFDPEKCHYISYNSNSGKQTDISPNLDDSILGYVNRTQLVQGKPDYPLGVAAWVKDGDAILVYDNNDIWQLDLQGRKPAVNITNHIGRSQNIVFSLFNSQRLDKVVPIVHKSQALLLRAFNTKNKYSGFYRKVIGTEADPELLYMGRYFMDLIPFFPHDANLSNKGMKPVKATNSDIWVVQRQSEAEAPNYWSTTDFRSFKRLTNFQPHKTYDWLTQELHSFSDLEGRKRQGILYKPESFDPAKQYPVIIVFYGRYSENLFQFPEPAYLSRATSVGKSPIWFLNNGYLVFTPDIYLTPLKYGPEAFNVIEGAAKYLNTLSYVDNGKIGAASHSWSAKLGAYIFTHSNSIAATAISEGFLYANMINTALSVDEQGASKLKDVEEGFQYGNLWDNKRLWLEQTTVLNVDKVKSPLLLLCNKQSLKDYQDQSVQLFTALRRLDKKVWWLKYDDGGHNLRDPNEQKDYTIRYTQYFDHFLKDAPAPRWMTRGVPAAMKGIDMAYELDPSGTCALDSKKDCEICTKWNEQYRRTPEMFTKPIVEWQLDADLVSELETKNQNQESTTHRK
jgi:dipeptidyl aminopeptidase/acylaminoacyl peptidase